MSSVAPTPNSDAPSAPAVAPRRPWHRLHASTWVVAGLVLAVLMNLAVPAYRIAANGAVGRGWPWIAVEYEARPDISENALGFFWSDHPAWLRWLLWTPNHLVGSYSLAALAADVLIAAVGIAVAALAFETWRRRRQRVWQLHLWELLVVPLLIGIAIAWYQSWVTGQTAERQSWRILVPRLNEGIGGVFSTTRYVGPDWFGRLFGPEWCGTMGRSVEWNCHDMDKENALRLVECADQFPWLTRFDAHRSTIDDNVLGTLCARARLEHIALGDAAVTDGGLRELKSQSRLKTLDLHGCPITDAGLPHLANLRSLQRLDLTKTRVTAAGIAQLKQSLPDTEIVGP